MLETHSKRFVFHTFTYTIAACKHRSCCRQYNRSLLTSFPFCKHAIKIQLASDVFSPPDVFPLTPIVIKLCKIEYCVNKMLQIIQNMMFSQGLELELSMFRRTTISGQHPLIYVWVQNLQKYSTP